MTCSLIFFTLTFTFFTLRQSDCESITNFISQLKAQAMLSTFNSKGSCNQNDCSVSFSEDMVKSQLIAGLRNPTHQSKVLSEMEALKTFELVTTRLLVLESTERASTHFRPPREVAAVAHQRSRRDKRKKNRTTEIKELLRVRQPNSPQRSIKLSCME